MAYVFGARSRERLATCHPDLVRLMESAIGDAPVDFTIVCGHRGKVDQDAAFAAGRSKVRWPNGKHNKSPSHAVDIAPYIEGEIAWSDRAAFLSLARHILARAQLLGLRVRWGGTWTGSADDPPAAFADMPHYEIRS